LSVRRPAQGTIRRWITPIFLAIVSLIAAFALWFAVTESDNPTRAAVFGAGIEVRAVNVPAGLAVASIRAPVVSLRVRASDDTLSRLTATDFRAEVDLSNLRQASADQVVILRVVGDKKVEIVEVSPPVVTVVLEPETTKIVQVVPNRIGSPPLGYSVPSVDPSPSSVRVTGATSLVQLVESAVAEINLTGVRVASVRQIPLAARDARSAEIRGVRIEPSIVDVRMGVVQQEVTQVISVQAGLQGSVADGYNLVGVGIDPPAIAISGPVEIIQGISAISTEAVDVGGLQKDLLRSARLRLPAGVQATRDTVNVRLRIVPAQGEIAVNVAPNVTGLGEGMRATLQTATITVKLRGEVPTLRGLTPGQVRATVSAAGLDEGVHVLTAVIAIPDGVTLASIEPTQVAVVLRR
jgi:YbbR domain-containing protein